MKDLFKCVCFLVLKKRNFKGWKMLIPSMSDEFDRFICEERRAIYPIIREFLSKNE